MANNNVEKLINECNTMLPLDGRILLAPDKIRMIKQKEPSLKVKEGTETKGKDGISKAVFEKEYPKIPAKYQTATVIQVPFDEKILSIGDKVVYVNGTTNDYDLVKGVSIIQRYNVVARLNNISKPIIVDDTLNGVYDEM